MSDMAPFDYNMKIYSYEKCLAALEEDLTTATKAFLIMSDMAPFNSFINSSLNYLNHDREATLIIERQSSADPNQTVVNIKAPTFEACQRQVENIMEKQTIATFTIPTQTADGAWVAVGRYPRKERLPEL